LKTAATEQYQKFIDRNDAGLEVAQELLKMHFHPDLVLTIPRGGVPVGLAVANFFGVPLKLSLIRKIGHPANPEYAIGAVGERENLFRAAAGIQANYLQASIKKERARIREMKTLYGHVCSAKDTMGKTIVLVDDGIATGTCMELAVKILRKAGAKKIGLAVPVCPEKTAISLSKKVDLFISILKPLYFQGVGAYYEDFSQLNDEEVIRMLS
jgi:predicted phosphoribosyltransferase